MFDWLKRLFGGKKEEDKPKQVSVQERFRQDQNRRAQQVPMVVTPQGRAEWVQKSAPFSDAAKQLRDQSRFSASNPQNDLNKWGLGAKPTPQRPPEQKQEKPEQKRPTQQFANPFQKNLENTRRAIAQENKNKETKRTNTLNTLVQSRKDPNKQVKLVDYRIDGGSYNNQSINDLRNAYSKLQGTRQNDMRTGVKKELSSIDQDFSDSAELKRTQLQLALSEMGAKERQHKTLGSRLQNFAYAMTKELPDMIGTQIATGLHAASGQTQQRSKDFQSQSNRYNDQAINALKSGNKPLAQYFASQADERHRQAQRSIGKVVEDSDPIKNAAAVAGAVAMPVAFAAQGATGGAAAAKGLTGVGAKTATSRLANTKVAQLAKNIETKIPQAKIGGPLEKTKFGKVLNSTPTQLVDKTIPNASPTLRAIAGESVANTLSGVPLSVAATGTQVGSNGSLEDYLISTATGAVMDAAFPAGMYGVGAGLKYAGKGVRSAVSHTQNINLENAHASLINSNPEYSSKVSELQTLAQQIPQAGETPNAALSSRLQTLQSDVDNMLQGQAKTTGQGGFIAGKDPDSLNNDPSIVSEGDYLQRNGAGFMDGSEPALHQNRINTKYGQGNAVNDALTNMAINNTRRAELRKEYAEKVTKGELREPTSVEKSLERAHGHDDLKSTQAARRWLEKQGVDWKTGEPPKSASDMSAADLPKHMDRIAEEASATTDKTRLAELEREFDAATERLETLDRVETARQAEAEVKARPKMTKPLRDEIDGIIFKDNPEMAYAGENLGERVLGEGGSSEIPRIHVDDLKHYFGNTEGIPTRYKRSTGDADIDLLAARAGYNDIDQFVEAIQYELGRRNEARGVKQKLAEMRRDPEIIALAQENIEKGKSPSQLQQSEQTPTRAIEADGRDISQPGAPDSTRQSLLHRESQKQSQEIEPSSLEKPNQQSSLDKSIPERPVAVQVKGDAQAIQDTQIDMAIKDSLKNMNTDVAELSKTLQAMRGLTNDEARARILKAADEMNVDLSTGYPSPRNTIDSAKADRSLLADNSDLKSPEELRRAIVEIPKVRGVENAMVVKQSNYQRVYAYRDKSTGKIRTFMQMRNMNGTWSKVNNSDVPIRSDFNTVKIERLKDDAALNAELSQASQDGLVRGFIWSDTPRGGELAKGGPNKQSAMIYSPSKHYVEGGVVRSRETGELLGNYVEVGPNGMRMTSGRHMIDLSEIEYGSLKNVNNSFLSSDRMVEAMTKNPKQREALRELLVYPARRGERNMAVEGKAVADRISEWDKRFKKLAPVGRKEQMDLDLSAYIERKLAPDDTKPGDVTGDQAALEAQDAIFKDRYGDEALTAAKEYDDWQRAIYDHTLNRINEKRIENGMDEIPRRENYLTHMQELSDNPILDAWNNVKDGIMGDVNGNELRGTLPSQVSGLSEHFKPISKYNPFTKHRYGNDTPANPRNALRTYMAVGLHNIHMTDAAQLARGFESTLRASGELAEAGPSKKLNKLQQKQWNDMLKANSNDKGRVVSWSNELANRLSGKTAKIDRAIVDAMGAGGEKGMRLIGKLSNLTSQTSILGNASTVIAQTMSLPNAIAKVGPVSTIKGITRTIRELGSDNKTLLGSDAMVTRYLEPKLLQESKLRKASNAVGIPLREVERATVIMQYNSFFEHGLSKGMSERAAHLYASREQGKVVPWRGSGDAAQIYNNKIANSTLLKFTREVNEQMIHWWKDLSPKQKITALALYSATNIASEAVMGRSYLPDPLAAAWESAGDFVDPDNEDSLGTKIGHAAQRGAATIAQAFPPITAAIQLLTTKDMREGMFGSDADISRYDSDLALTGPLKNIWKAGENAVKGDFYDATADLAAGVVTGGSQIRKTMKGVRAYIAGEKRSSNGRIQTQIDQSPMNLIRGILFGDNAFPEAQDYYSSKKSPLSEKQSKIYDQIKKAGGDADGYLKTTFENRGKNSSSLATNADMAEVEATKSVNIESGTWREEDGLLVNKAGRVQRSYYKALAQASDGQSDQDYNNWMKAHNIDGASTRAKKINSSDPVLAKLSASKTTENQASTAVSMMKNTEEFADMPDWVKDKYYKKSGFTNDDVVYATKSSYRVDEKMDGYWRPLAKKASHDELVQELLNGRKKGINGYYWATAGIIDNLRREGHLSYNEAKNLKAASYNSKGTAVNKKSGSRGGGRGKGGATKAQKTAAVNAMIAAYKSSMKARVPTTSGGSSKTPPSGRVQMKQTALRSNGLQTSNTSSRAPKITVKKVG